MFTRRYRPVNVRQPGEQASSSADDREPAAGGAVIGPKKGGRDPPFGDCAACRTAPQIDVAGSSLPARGVVRRQRRAWEPRSTLPGFARRGVELDRNATGDRAHANRTEPGAHSSADPRRDDRALSGRLRAARTLEPCRRQPRSGSLGRWEARSWRLRIAWPGRGRRWRCSVTRCWMTGSGALPRVGPRGAGARDRRADPDQGSHRSGCSSRLKLLGVPSGRCS